MHIYSGKLTHIDGYAQNELWTVTFPNEIREGDDAIVIYQWTRTYGGDEKKNSELRGKITKVGTVKNGPTQIEIFKGDSDLYYWFSGTISSGNDRIDLEMKNPKDEYCGPVTAKVIYKA